MFFCRLPLFICLFATATQPLSARDIDFDASLSVEIRAGNDVDVQLVLANRSPRNVCFFLDDSWPVLLSKDGTHLPVRMTGVEIPIHIRPDNAQVVWNDGQPQYFDTGLGINRPYQTSASLDDVAQVTYDLTVFDCDSLFSHSYQEKKPLLSRHLSAVPANVPLRNVSPPPPPP